MAEVLSKIVPVFLRVMQMSFSAGIVILLIALIRPFVGRASKRLGFWLWALVALRLILPAFPVSRLSLVKGTEFTAAVEYLETKREEQNTALPGPTEQEGGSQETESAPPAENTDAAVLGIPMTVLAGIWMAGIGGMTVYLAISLLRTGRKVSGAAHFRDNLYFCSETESAFIFGLLRPKVIIPAFTEETQLPFIEEHEKTHIRRLDHIWKALGFVLLMLHWMNPLVWIAYMLFARDMELACDEDMIREKDPSYRKEYAEVLILYSTKKRMSASAMPGFGGKMITRRINCIMKYKKPAPLALILAVLLCLTACGGAITNKIEMAENKSEQNIVEPTSTQDKIEQNTVENVSEKPKLTEAQQKAADELMALSDAELYKWTEDWAIPGKETFPDEKSYVDAVRAVIEGMISNADWDVDYNFRAFSFTWVNKGVPAVREAAKRTIGLISDTGEVKPKLTEAQQKAADELMALSDEKLYQWAEDWAIPEKEAFPDKKSYVNSVRAVIIEMISNADWDKDLYFGNFSFTWVNNWVNKGIPAVREAAKKTIGLIP